MWEAKNFKVKLKNKNLYITLVNFMDTMYKLDKSGETHIVYEYCGFNEDGEEIVGANIEFKGEKYFLIFKAKDDEVNIF